jgi:hypothetical protein
MVRQTKGRTTHIVQSDDDSQGSNAPSRQYLSPGQWDNSERTAATGSEKSSGHQSGSEKSSGTTLKLPPDLKFYFVGKEMNGEMVKYCKLCK